MSRGRGFPRGQQAGLFAAQRPAPTPQPGKLIVRNYPAGTTDDELKNVFERFGRIEEVFSPMDKVLATPRGYSFVKYYNPEDAESALKAMNGTEFKGGRLRVEVSLFAKGDGGPPGRGGGRGGLRGRGGPPPSRDRGGPPHHHGRDRDYYRDPPPPPHRGYDYYYDYEREGRRDPYYDYDYRYRRSPPHRPRDAYYDRDPYYRSDDRYPPPDRYRDRYAPLPSGNPYAQDRYQSSDRYQLSDRYRYSQTESYDSRSGAGVSQDSYAYDRREYDRGAENRDTREGHSAGNNYYSSSSQGNGYSTSGYGASTQGGRPDSDPVSYSGSVGGKREGDQADDYVGSRRAPEGSVSYPTGYSSSVDPSGADAYRQY